MRGVLAVSAIVAAGIALNAEAQSPAEGRDAQMIGTLRDRASRDGPTLILQLDGNRSLRIVDDTSGEKRRHEMVAWWPKHRLYVVDVVMHEAREAHLISARDGRTTRVAAPPVLSPSGQYAIAWDPSPLIGNPMELIDLRSDPPVVGKVMGMPACPGAGQQHGVRPDPVWLDEQRVTFTGKSLFSADDPKAKQVLRIVDGKPEWEC